ncbi:unnamed protein product [Cuscuta campestris]|uniref:USP domain-containing protein n=1 Tax=Cuscuta campestris TaxID=132261 RepID=A0A484L5E4_9ASTE|nr:unnamed protein product [Cuscuta campestris]
MPQIPIQVMPKGILNEGGTCHFISVLQALISVEPFKAIFENGLAGVHELGDCKEMDWQFSCTLCELHEFMKSYQKADSKCDPMRLVYAWWFNQDDMGRIQFGYGDFWWNSLNSLLLQLHEEDKRSTNACGTDFGCVSHFPFNGIVRTTFKCPQCDQFPSSMMRPFNYLELEHGRTVEEGLKNYSHMAMQSVDGSEFSHCSHKVLCYELIQNYPRVLCLKVKDKENYEFVGDNIILDSIKYKDELDFGCIKYELKAVIIQTAWLEDGEEAGHIMALTKIKHNGQNQWFCCDDESVSIISKKKRKEESATGLFYVRADWEATDENDKKQQERDYETEKHRSKEINRKCLKRKTPDFRK